MFFQSFMHGMLYLLTRCYSYSLYHIFIFLWYSIYRWGWSGGAKVLRILHHWGVQLILAYSWARPAILVVGKGRGGMFLFLLFLLFHSCSSFFPVPLFHLLYSLFSLFSLSLGDDTKWPSRVDVSLNPNTIKKSIYRYYTFSMTYGYFSLFLLVPWAGSKTYSAWLLLYSLGCNIILSGCSS